jgi:hypothetical protein
MRAYTDSRQQSVLVILMCGRTGRMAVHTPEVCYRGAGYEMIQEPAAISIVSDAGSFEGAFRTANFVSGADRPSGLQLHWAWSTGSLWQAPDSPRWTFRGEPFLYKLYVSQNVSSASGEAPQVTGIFLKRFLPELRKALTAE